MERTAPSRQPRTLPVLLQGVFLVSLPFGVLSFILPVYGKALGANAVEVGGFFSAFSIVPVIVRPFLGRALDRWGRRPFLLLGVAGYTVAMILFFMAQTVWLLTLARFIQGLGQAFFWLSAVTVVADVAAESGRGRDFGVLDEASNRGALIGGLIGFGAISQLSRMSLGLKDIWFWLFFAYTIPTVLTLLRTWRDVGETRPPAAYLSPESRPISRQLLALMGIVLVTGASTNMVWPLLVIFLQDSMHAEVPGIIWAYLPAAILGAYLPSRLGHLADRVGRKPPMMAGLLVSALASALIPHLQSLILLAVLWAVENVGYAAQSPAERAFVADIAGEDVRGSSYGLYTFAYFLGGALGPLVGGWLYDSIAPAAPFYLNAVALVLSAGLVALMLRETREASAQAGLAEQAQE